MNHLRYRGDVLTQIPLMKLHDNLILDVCKSKQMAVDIIHGMDVYFNMLLLVVS